MVIFLVITLFLTFLLALLLFASSWVCLTQEELGCLSFTFLSLTSFTIMMMAVICLTFIATGNLKDHYLEKYGISESRVVEQRN